MGTASLVVLGPDCVGHLEVSGTSIKSENLVNSEFHESVTMKATGIQASLNQLDIDLHRDRSESFAAGMPIGLEVARVRSSFGVTMRTKYSGWEVDARKQFAFLTSQDVKKRLGLELDTVQQVSLCNIWTSGFDVGCSL